MAKKEAPQRVSISEKRIGLESPMVVSKLTETCLYSGFFGRLDSARMKSITDEILEAIEQSNNESIVIDLSNVDIIDSAVAAHLIRTGDVIRLVGCNVIFCGINSRVAQAMITVGVEFSKYLLCKDLKSALKLVFELQGLMLVPIPKTAAHSKLQMAEVAGSL
ncbi:MAG TPA: STAS domain-containing protein [Puia sp.]|jgi:rsbT co-antagonist protein RsbR|nr:STAS domain-containing protein [Puia sp.]